MADLRYPIGPFQAKSASTPDDRREFLRQLAEAPARLRTAVDNLSSFQLDSPYRPDGWTVRQVVHHLADAHLNWYARTKLALSETQPVIKPFDEKLWADLSDARVGLVESSLSILDGLHQRWVQMFESLRASDWTREIMHPERGLLSMDTILSMVAWHSRHHTAHITELRKRMSW